MKKIDRKNIPNQFSIWTPFIIYTMIHYWQLPIWLFAVYMTLYVILFAVAVVVEVKTTKVDIFKDGVE